MDMLQKTKSNSIPLQKIKIQDAFWSKYTKLVKDEIIPYQWNTLNDRVKGAEPSHCIRNFKIAAGEQAGEFQGAVFQDTDVAKWLEAVAYTLATDPDAELEQLADETIELIGRAQGKDGYLDTYFTIKEPELRWTNLMEGHELYTAGHMIEAAVAYYEATGKDKFVRIVSKLADLIGRTFGPGEEQLHGYPGHQEVELALVKLYRITGKKEYLETAKYFIDIRGVGENYFIKEQKCKKFKPIFWNTGEFEPKYSQSDIPVREQLKAEGHAVRAVYMYSAMADLAYEYQDEGLLQACKNLWNNIVSKRMFITGSIGSSGILERFTTDYDLPNDRNYSETCASIGLALFGLRMAQITKEASYIDTVERALYNTVLSGIAMDGKSFFYVNPLEVWPDNCLSHTSMEHVKPVRQKWFGVACCPPNIARTLASLGQYIYATERDTLYVNMYVGGSAKPDFPNKDVEITVETGFPFTSNIKINTRMKKDTTINMALRIPQYAEKYTVMRNGESVACTIRNGYAVLEEVGTEETIKIDILMPPKFLHANPQVRADIGKVAIIKGPLVYCLEECDNGQNLANIYVDTEKELIEKYEPDLLGGILTIWGKGKKVSLQDWKENELYKQQEMILKDVEFRAVPYCNWGNRKTGEMIVWLKEKI